MAFQIQVLAPSLISYSLGMPWVSKEVAVLSISTHTHTNIHTKRHFPEVNWQATHLLMPISQRDSGLTPQSSVYTSRLQQKS